MNTVPSKVLQDLIQTPDWTQYYKGVISRTGNQPSPLAQRVFSRPPQLRRKAIDIGCGSLRDTALILQMGFEEVIALDDNPSVRKMVETSPCSKNGRMKFVEMSFRDYDFGTDAFDLVHSFATLPFNGPVGLDQLVERLIQSTSPGGLLSLSFTGIYHWRLPYAPYIAAVSKDDLARMFRRLTAEIIEHRDIVEEQPVHTFEVLAVK